MRGGTCPREGRLKVRSSTTRKQFGPHRSKRFLDKPGPTQGGPKELLEVVRGGKKVLGNPNPQGARKKIAESLGKRGGGGLHVNRVVKDGLIL